jgi:hypothetical protein
MWTTLQATLPTYPQTLLRRLSILLLVLHINTEDVHVTRQIAQAGKLLDIELLDHLILAGGGRYASLKERGQGFD